MRVDGPCYSDGDDDEWLGVGGISFDCLLFLCPDRPGVDLTGYRAF